MQNLNLGTFILVLSFHAQADIEINGCLEENTKTANEALDTHIENAPGSYIADELKFDRKEGDVLFFRGVWATYHAYAFNFRYETTFEFKMENQCESIDLLNIKDKVLNITHHDIDKSPGNACMFEFGRSCDEGMVDRCVYPEAEYHGCVPDLREE